MKKIVMVCLFIFTAVCLQAQTLSWDIQFLSGRAQESVPINQIIRMQTGDVFLITIRPASDCFGYIVSYDSQRQVNVIFNEPLLGGDVIYIGPFDIEPPSGTETLYVIMSMERQTRLEGLIQSYSDNPDSRQHSSSLYREVVKFQNEVSVLGEPASTFIASGGTTRGRSGNYVNRFSGKDLYVRAISIRH